MSTKYKMKSGTIYYDKKLFTIDQVLDYIKSNKPTTENIDNQHCEWNDKEGNQVCSLFGCTYNHFMSERKLNEVKI